MMSCPEDVCGAWWRVVGDALTCWFDDHDASRVPQTSVKLPAGIISRMIGQIKYVEARSYGVLYTRVYLC